MMSTQDETSNSEVTLDSAYSKLEGIIRNFSREKMLLDDRIDTLNRQVELAESRLKESNKNLITITVERDKLKHIHDEDETARFMVEAMVISCEKKIQVLSDTLTGFDEDLQTICSSSGSRDEFNQLVKNVQLTLRQRIKAEELRHSEVTKEYNDEVNSLAIKCQTLDANLAQEKEKSKQLLDLTAKDIAIKNEIIEQMRTDKQQIENQLVTQMRTAKQESDELQDIVNHLTQKCNFFESDLAKEKETSKQMVESLTKDIADKTGKIDQLEKEKQQIEDKLVAQMRALKLASDELQETVNQLTLKCNLFESNLADEKEASKQMMESLTKDIADKTEMIEKLEKEKQQIEGQLVTQMRTTKQEADELQDTVNQLTRKCNLFESNLSDEKETSKQMVDSLTKDIADKTGKIDQLEKEKQQIEDKLVAQIRALKLGSDELQDTVNQLTQKCNFFESDLTQEKEVSKQMVESLTQDIAGKSETIDELGKEKQRMEDEFATQMRTIKQEADELQETVNQLTLKCNFFESDLAKEKEVSKQMVESLTKNIADKTEMIDQLGKEKQKIENKLVAQMRATKEKEDELQDIVKQNAKQIQLIRSGYEDLSAMLEITKNEKSALAESYSKLQDDKKQMELHLTDEINTKKDKVQELQEELETLRFVQKRYIELKAHLSSLMKEKPSKEITASFSSLKLTEKKNSSSSHRTQEEKSKKDDETLTPRPLSRLSYPPTTTPGRSPKGILKNQTENGDKKNVSFGDPLEYNLVATSSSESSPEPEPTTNSKPDSQVTTYPPQKQKRPSDPKQTDKKDLPDDKRAKPSETTDLGNGAVRKFFRKKTVPSPSPFKVYK